MEPICPCGSGRALAACCEPYIVGMALPQMPEALMRSRYTAYTLHNADYIYNTTSPSERRHHNKKDIFAWAKSCNWIKLEVLYAKEDIVEFKAYYLDASLRSHIHYERSSFENINGQWYYKDGVYP